MTEVSVSEVTETATPVESTPATGTNGVDATKEKPKSRGRAQDRIEQLARDKRSMQRELDAAVVERDEAYRERDLALRDRDEAYHLRDKVFALNEQLVAAVNQLRGRQ